jgi:hypothetical protein
MPESTYRISLWGKLDNQKQFVIGERTFFLKYEFNFYKEDGTTLAGEPLYRIQPIPGSKNRPAIFTADKWKEYFVEIKSPSDAVFLVCNVKFENGSDAGKTNGVIFIDDFNISGTAGIKQTPDPARPDPAPAENTPTAQ